MLDMVDLVVRNLLLTGPPLCGKTTAVLRLVERLAGLRVVGQPLRGPGVGSAARWRLTKTPPSTGRSQTSPYGARSFLQ
jgi:hypothetical protein